MWHINASKQQRDPLIFEGDKAAVLRAVIEEDPGLHCIHVGNGVGAVSSTGFASAAAAFGLFQQRPFVGTSFSSGTVNQTLLAYGKARSDTGCYCTHFCTARFVRPGLRAWFRGTKLSIDHYGAVLRQRLRGVQPSHRDSQLHIVVTNYETGEPVVLTPDLADTNAVVRAAKASAYLPCCGPGYVKIRGVPYTDGGIATPIPLAIALQQRPRFLLILMASAEHSPLQYRLAERAIVAYTMRHAPHVTRTAAYGRHEQFAATVAYIRAQWALPQEHPDRVLPPTLMVWPGQPVGIVEQREVVVAAAIRVTFHAWLHELQRVYRTLDGAG